MNQMDEQQSVDLSYDVPLIPQPNKLACWAASMAMLISYQQQQSVDPETVASSVGYSLRQSYGWDLLKAAKDYFGFQEISLPSNASLFFTAAQWSDWLRQYGPLWVTEVGNPSHAVVVAGIHGDQTLDGTTVDILNPWDIYIQFDGDPVDFNPMNDGVRESPTFSDFAANFGNMDLPDYGDWRVLYLQGV